MPVTVSRTFQCDNCGVQEVLVDGKTNEVSWFQVMVLRMNQPAIVCSLGCLVNYFSSPTTSSTSHTHNEPKPCGCGEHHHGPEASINEVASASAEVAKSRRFMQTDAGMVEVLPSTETESHVPLEDQGHGGH